jgi:UDP-N-acetylmuramyl pentapeptide synthase
MLVVVGQWRHQTAAAAQAAGLKEIHTFETIPAAASFVRAQTRPGDLILLKASRAAGFEQFYTIWGEEV